MGRAEFIGSDVAIQGIIFMIAAVVFYMAVA
jgi:hypothetical protein